MILVDNVPLTINVAAWMNEVHAKSGRYFDGMRGGGDGREWVQSTCPFHDDRHASFAVNSETGVFKCQACGVGGDFVKLVKHVEAHDTLLDAEQSLLSRFARFVPDVDEELTLDFDDGEEETFVDVDAIKAWADRPKYDNVYLYKRGIWLETQRAFDVWFDLASQAAMFPWFDAHGRCVTIKYRSVVDKRFWYDPPVSAGRLKRLLYGFHLAKSADLIVVCEGEIDAMSVVQSGYSAVALGGSSISATQASLLRNSGASEIVVFTDNDKAGRKARQAIVDALVGHKRVSVVDWSLTAHNPAKDANDVLRGAGESFIAKMIENRINVPLPLKFD